MQTVLVVTNRDDLHASAVIAQLHALQCPVFRLNTERMLLDYRIGLLQQASGDQLTLRALDYPRLVQGSEIGAVYYRRPASPEVSDAQVTDVAARGIIASESRQFLRWLYAYLQRAWWFADPFELDRLQSKPLQILHAREAGLHTPATFYGNDAQVAAGLRGAGTIAVKSMREMGFVDDGQYRAFYTAMVDAAELLDDPAGVELNTNFFQAAVAKAYELRITYIDGVFRAVRIDSQAGPQAARQDWRRVWWDDLAHELVELPNEISAALDRFMRSLKLRFGAIDMIVTPAGEYVFLECNANGQWLWLDEVTEAGIAQAIAQRLALACASGQP